MEKEPAKPIDKDALGKARESDGLVTADRAPAAKEPEEPAEKPKKVEIPPPAEDAPKEGEQMQG
jgi:hypothetical protein